MPKIRMSASCTAGIAYLLETNTGTYWVSESCVITEHYFNLMGCLVVRVAETVILLSLKASRSAAQSSSLKTLSLRCCYRLALRRNLSEVILRLPLARTCYRA